MAYKLFTRKKKKSCKGKKGQHFVDMLSFIAVFLVVAIGFVFWHLLFSDFNDQLQGQDGFDNTSKQIMQDYTTGHNTMLDNMILILFVGLILGTFVGAYLVDIFPVLFWINLPMFIVFMLVLLIMNNFWFEIMSNSELSSVVITFPKTMFIMDNWLALMIPVFVITSVLYFGKRQSG